MSAQSSNRALHIVYVLHVNIRSSLCLLVWTLVVCLSVNRIIQNVIEDFS